MATAVLVSAAAAAMLEMPAPSSVDVPSAVTPGGQAGTLMSMVRLAGERGAARGLLAPSSCRPAGAMTVICVAPARGIAGVVLTTSASPRALYAAYVRKVRSLNSGRLPASLWDCGKLSSPALAGKAGRDGWFWRRHADGWARPGAVTVAPWVASRLFCDVAGGTREEMVWTQDQGRILGWVTGEPLENVWDWWVVVHHSIGFPCHSSLVVPVPATVAPPGAG